MRRRRKTHSAPSAATTRFSWRSAMQHPRTASCRTPSRSRGLRRAAFAHNGGMRSDTVQTTPETKRVAIVGATGYAGSELTGILAKHPGAEVVALFSSGNGAAAPANPAFPELIAQPFTIEALLASKPDIVFLATP